MKTQLKSIAVMITFMLTIKANAQQGLTDANPHHGFNYSFYIGGAGGHVTAHVEGLGTAVFSGPSIHVGMHFGYSVNNWAFGLASDVNSLSINSIKLDEKSMDKGDAATLDNRLIGVYVTKYFMPNNVFVSGEGGFGLFTTSDADGNSIGRSDAGFAWNVKAGKEFLVGKKKILGLGFYVDLAGLRCHDQAPRSKDTYSYLSPGGGFILSVH